MPNAIINYCIKAFWDKGLMEGLMECPPSELGKITVSPLPEGAQILDLDFDELEELQKEFPKWAKKHYGDNPTTWTDEIFNEFLDETYRHPSINPKLADVQVWYGVHDSGGMEWFVNEYDWLNMEDSIRHGSYRWWLDWCRNGGRNGTSQPFSIYLTEKQAKNIIKKLQSGEKEEREEAHKIIMTHPTFGYLYPWSQHSGVLRSNAVKDIIERGDDVSDNLEEAQENLGKEYSRYGSARQKLEGLVRWPKGFRFL